MRFKVQGGCIGCSGHRRKNNACPVTAHLQTRRPDEGPPGRGGRITQGAGPPGMRTPSDTSLVFDTHWLSNFGCDLNAKGRHRGPDEPRGAAHDSEHELRLCRPSAAAGSAGRAALGAGLKPEWLDEHWSRGRAEGCLLLRARRARPSSESANGGSVSARRGRGASTW